MNKKNFLILIISMLLLGACQAATPTASPEIYVVKEETGLFAALEVGSDQIATLPAGTQLIPADGQATLFCDTLDEAGMAFDQCKVEVLDTGQVGWVLPYSIEQQ